MGRKNYTFYSSGIGEGSLIIITIVGISILNLFILFLCRYKIKERKKIQRKKNRLGFFYGISMFIVDHIPRWILERNIKVNKALKKLTVKEDIKRDVYLYNVQKVSICIVVIEIAFLLTLVVGITEKTEQKNINTVTRSPLEDSEYNLEIQDKDGHKEQITINVARKQYTRQQIDKIFQKRKDELIKKVLDKNKSPNKVDKKLNLVSRIGKEQIMISWNISDSEKIDYDGTLSEDIQPQGEVIILTATMTLEKHTQDYCFAVNVFPPVQKTSRVNKLQTYIDKNQIYSETVELPKKIDGKEITYYKITSKTSSFILPLGVIIAILLFILKDNNLKKEVEQRDRQMQNDYPEIVSKLLLYYGTGLSMKGIIEKMVKGYEAEKKEEHKLYRYAYEELTMCWIKIKSGVSESVAMNEYGERCKLHCYIKLAGLVEQNMRRGTKDLTFTLKNELKEAMNEKKNNLLRNGGQISTKLLGPMIIMLLISVVIIMVPAFMSMGI